MAHLSPPIPLHSQLFGCDVIPHRLDQPGGRCRRMSCSESRASAFANAHSVLGSPFSSAIPPVPDSPSYLTATVTPFGPWIASASKGGSSIFMVAPASSYPAEVT